MGNAKSTEFSHPYNYHSQESFSVCRRAGDKNTKKQQPAFIADNFNSLDEVITALRDAGLESSNLILGIDFTKSNEWTGRHSFNRRSLHSIGDTPNPYEQAISIIGRTLASFDDDNLIPCFGFGDGKVFTLHFIIFVLCIFQLMRIRCYVVTTRDEEALSRYREIVPYLTLSGPTSFAPLILAAVDIVERSHGQYHVLVIVADGQVSGGSTQPNGGFSQQEQATIDAIVYASYYPLSIIMVGVGDGPWDAMQQFDDFVPRRSFDNFQFVNFTKIMSGNMTMEKKEAAFALSALMEIPFQYRATQALCLLRITGERKPLRPPREVIEHDNATASREFTKNIQPMEYNIPQEKACFICFANPKDMAFGCGHLTCRNCGMSIDTCPCVAHP
uniref:RING-type domain-containing protein n=1 Tax=Ananas comosus var. bracteatus TaxID=296719 RepID=A0A6V7NI87_ANACO|nr:unnamed protein product [Ananas comosus var. bracteatus]